MNNITFNSIKEAKNKITALENKAAIDQLIAEKKEEKITLQNVILDKVNKEFKNIVFKGSKIKEIRFNDSFFLKSKPFKGLYTSFKQKPVFNIYFYFIPTSLKIIDTDNNHYNINLDLLASLKNIEGYEKEQFVHHIKNIFKIKNENGFIRYFFDIDNFIINHIKDVLKSESLYNNKDKIYIDKQLNNFKKERFNKENYEYLKKLFSNFFKEYYFKEILKNNNNFSIGFKKYTFQLTYIDHLIYNLLRNKDLFYGMENIKQNKLERRFFLEKNIINLFNYFENGDYFFDFLLQELTIKDKRFNFVKDIKRLAK